MTDKKAIAETTILYNNLAKVMRDWMLSHPKIAQMDYHKVLLATTGMLAANQMAASTELSGLPFEAVKKWFDIYVDGAMVERGFPSERL